MSTFLVVNNSSIECQTSAEKPYLKIANKAYLPLTTETSIGGKITISNSTKTYIVVESPAQTTTTTTTSEVTRTDISSYAVIYSEPVGEWYSSNRRTISEISMISSTVGQMKISKYYNLMVVAEASSKGYDASVMISANYTGSTASGTEVYTHIAHYNPNVTTAIMSYNGDYTCTLDCINVAYNANRIDALSDIEMYATRTSSTTSRIGLPGSYKTRNQYWTYSSDTCAQLLYSSYSTQAIYSSESNSTYSQLITSMVETTTETITIPLE